MLYQQVHVNRSARRRLDAAEWAIGLLISRRDRIEPVKMLRYQPFNSAARTASPADLLILMLYCCVTLYSASRDFLRRPATFPLESVALLPPDCARCCLPISLPAALIDTTRDFFAAHDAFDAVTSLDDARYSRRAASAFRAFRSRHYFGATRD